MANIPALGIQLDNLKELVRYNADLIDDENKNGFEDLWEVLDALIKNYPGWQDNTEFNQDSGNRVTDLVFEVENAVETHIVLASKEKNRSLFSRAIHLTEHAYDHLRKLSKQIAEHIAELRRQLINIQQNCVQNLPFEASPVDEISSSRPKKKQTLVEEATVVGFENSAKEVIELLIGRSQPQQEELQVISIIGTAGIGKTTLARKVINDPEIEYEFSTRAFIDVSQEYKKKEVFLNILASVTRFTKDMREMSDDQLAEAVQKQLKTRKYLVVMDDVWTTNAWDDLKIALPNDNNGSRVLITSQQEHVGHFVNKMIGPYYLRSLSPEASRELLQRKVFDENCCPPELESYELQILRKCKGLPLAIVAVAGILRNIPRNTNWWMRVADHYVADNEDYRNDAIRLNYNHLPDHLKPCFLYLGVFPQDFDIPVWILLRLWIAEGFIQHTRNRNLEDVAEDYLMELVERSLVMIRQRRSNGLIKTCRINNILRNFCKKEAIKENLFRDMKELNESSPSSFNQYRRLCLNSNVLEYINSKPSTNNVRSFLSFARKKIPLIPEQEVIPLNPEQALSIAKAFTLIRVLDIRSVTLTRLPTDLIHLVLLKYLAMSCNFKVLPVRICNLQNLQTIILNTSSRTLEIRGDILKVAQLRHLHTNSSTILSKGKEEYSGNANLQTLSTISPESCTREVFVRAPKLRKLGICGKLASFTNENGESALFDSLIKLEFLENLKLLNDVTTSRSKLHSLPREDKFPGKLRSLTLQDTSLEWRHISTLGRLQNLEVLKLKRNAFVGKSWETEDGDFRSLKVLKMQGLDLVVWTALASNFPELRSLSVRECGKLQGLPSRLGEIQSLQVIDLYNTSHSVATSARSIYMLKLRLQAQKKGHKAIEFKLSVYPPDE